MADRRMFSKTIIDSDAFLDMPLSAQCLYFHLSMRADDDGFVNNPKKIQRMIGASDDDFKLLIMKQFVLVFDAGIIVIKHWRMHNYIRSDRYKPTAYQKEKRMLVVTDNGSYDWQSDGSQSATECLPVGIPNGNQMDTQVRLGKDRLGKDRLGKDRLGKDRLGENICSEPLENKRSKQETKTPSEYNIPLNDGTEYNVPLEEIELYKGLYKAIDVEQEIKRIIGWCYANERKRKTRKGIGRFINAWLSRAQDGGGRNGTRTNQRQDAANRSDTPDKPKQVCPWEVIL